jgi:hypothetical protein
MDKKPRWERILELEQKAREADAVSVSSRVAQTPEERMAVATEQTARNVQFATNILKIEVIARGLISALPLLFVLYIVLYIWTH